MSKTITIDPVTRIEGHLKITVEVDNGVVVDAHSAGTMFRGIEKLLEGKDPRDASFVTSRACGVCFSVHTMASALALDQAFGATVPAGGRILRNLMMAAQYVYDHILHFYHLSALDYIDVTKIPLYSGANNDLIAVRDKIKWLIDSNDPHPLAPTYAADEYCVSDPELATTLVSHYLQALRMQMLAKRLGAIFGGRAPHYQSIVVGGVTKLPTKDDIALFRSLLTELTHFVSQVYVPDVVLLGTGVLLPLATSDFGVGHGHFLSYGAFNEKDDGSPLFAGGVIESINPADLKIATLDESKITESVKHAWYKDHGPLHPSVGETDADPTIAGAYSFIKAPRYGSKPFEVGPLARMLIRKEPRLMDLVAKGVKPGTIARHAARAFETTLVCDAMMNWLNELEEAYSKPDFKIHDAAHWDPPAQGVGKGMYDAPRGGLGHWITVEDHKIKRYQAVVPTTWNASPRDEQNVRGPYEESLIGCPVPDEDNPLHIVRTIRSYDPCLGCAVHIIDSHSNELKKFIVDPITGTWGPQCSSC